MLMTIPYGERAILVGERTVTICDRILLREDYTTNEELMAAVDDAYQNYIRNFRG